MQKKVVAAVRAAVFAYFALGGLLFFNPILLMVPTLTLMFVHYGFYRRFVDFFTASWTNFMGGLIEVVMGCPIVLTGDNIPRKCASLSSPFLLYDPHFSIHFIFQ